MTEQYDAVVVGGCGHVGLPLSIALADRGARIMIHDIDQVAVALVNDGRLPFDERDAAEPLRQAVTAGRLTASTDPAVTAAADTVVVVIGTPIDEHLNPNPFAIRRDLGAAGPHLRDGQLLILRSTVYPGVTQLVERTMADRGLDIDVAFCPERIAEGQAMTELYAFPQIVGARTDRALRRAGDFFRRLTDRIIPLSPEEAELAKLFTNTWRYVKFAATNQFYMIANSRGLDYERIRAAVVADYPRAADLPRAGFAAGPCLFKDAMQLAAFNDNQFYLGHSAMLVNEGLPLYVVSQLERRYDLPSMTVGVLGMAFKAGSDDIRSSLSYKLRRILSFKARAVLCTDPYVRTDPTLLPLDKVVEEADLLVVATPHPEYRDLDTDKPVADVWNVLGRGVLV
jgi:UDP-N-acetyl-D-mannosaminuronic acid dehydrogenase